MDINTLFQTFTSLAGVGAFVSVFVNVLKVLGVVKDGEAEDWVTGLDLVCIVLLFVANLLGFKNFAAIDAKLSLLAQILTLALQLVSAKAGSVAFYKTVRGVPFIGASFSKKTFFGFGGPSKA